MSFWPSYYSTPQELRTKTGDGRNLVFLSGYAVFDFKGSGGSWRGDTLLMIRGPRWRRLDDVVPIVSLASISNWSTAVNAGWAVDWCHWSKWPGDYIYLQTGLAIRDIDGYIHRVAYHITATGILY